MVKRLAGRRAEVLIEMGRPILDTLEVDPRLDEAAGCMKIAQRGLETRSEALEAARVIERLARVERGEAHRVLGAETREFALIILSGNGNHHDADPYVLYFPDGYGDVMQLTPAALGEFGHLILTKLEEETNPKVLAHREPIEKALDRLVAAEEAYQAAHRARAEAFALVQAEKRNWARGVTLARALADSAVYYEPAYVRSIFAPVARRRRRVVREASGVESPAERPAEPLPVQEPPGEAAA